jgi:hypothetical protein
VSFSNPLATTVQFDRQLLTKAGMINPPLTNAIFSYVGD